MSALIDEFRNDKRLHCAGINRLPNRKEPSFLISQIASARSSREILTRCNARILGLFGANYITIYEVNIERKEVYSYFNVSDKIDKIRVPISQASIPWYVAKTGHIINIRNVHNDKEVSAIHPQLRFDQSWDSRTGRLTKQILAVPVRFHRFPFGVFQLSNKFDGGYFNADDEELARKIASAAGLALHKQHAISSKQRAVKFEYLAHTSLITEEELRRAIVYARSNGMDLEEILLEDYKISKQDVGKALSQFYRTEFIPFDPNTPIPGELPHNLKPSYLRNNLWVPIKRDNGLITVLMHDPNDLTKRDMACNLLKSNNVEFCVSLKEDILKFLDYFFCSPMDENSIDDIIGRMDLEEELDDEKEMFTESDNVIVQFVHKMIIDACNKRASDIHIETNPGRSNVQVRFRVDGLCIPYQTIPYHYKRAVVSRLKILAHLNIAERRLPQDGKIQFRKAGNNNIELRVATLPLAAEVEDVTLRVLNGGELVPMGKLGFTDANLKAFERLIEMPYGIVLVVGPTGSGKTTTVHAALAHINQPERKILTAEDPVEITQPGLRQVQVMPKIPCHS